MCIATSQIIMSVVNRKMGQGGASEFATGYDHARRDFKLSSRGASRGTSREIIINKRIISPGNLNLIG